LQGYFKGNRDENCFEIPAPAHVFIAGCGIDTSHQRGRAESGGCANSNAIDRANPAVAANVATEYRAASCAFADARTWNTIRSVARRSISAGGHSQFIPHTNTDATCGALRAGSLVSSAH